MKQLSPKVVEQLGYYVYLYIDPLDDTVFYVGKGKGDRALAHLGDTSESDKVKTFKRIRAQGREPRMEILLHGLEDETTDDVNVPGRWEFTGVVADPMIRDKYVGKSVKKYLVLNSQNPIK